LGSVSGSGPVESGTMFLSAAIFLAILLAMSAFVYYGEREQSRVLREGRKTRATVVEKQKDRKGTKSLLLRLPDRPEVQPFWRVYLEADWDALKPGDALDYVCEREFPEAGVIGTPRKQNYAVAFALIFSVFVAPFLVIGTIIRRRERSRAGAGPSPG